MSACHIPMPAWLFVIGVGLLSNRLAVAEEPVRFNRDIRPILADACFSCHGPAKQKGGLRLDERPSALEGGVSGEAAIAPGQPDKSELIRRITSDDPDVLMPPAESHKKLTPAQKETLRRWIAQGATYETHWAFAPIVKPAGQSIDEFLNARRAKEGLTANPEADRPTLIRRVAFALTGLPPTLDEQQLFYSDQSPQAYERMVERYLASPRYGEEMARHWLDLARYADTHGLHLDNERATWPYRDWVVNAFNANMPFDRFTTEQLAGDLLPNPTPEQLVATGYTRCNVSTSEGGSIVEEWLFRNAVDRAATTIETWLGLTAGCAVCHDHKYDPLTMRDFYSLYAFFYSIQGPALDGNKLLHEPFLKLATPEQQQKLQRYDERLAQLDKEIETRLKGVNYADPADAAGGEAPEAKADITRSFKAWLKARGGKDKSKLPRDIQQIFNSLSRIDSKPSEAQEKQLRTYFLQAVCVDTRSLFEPLLKEREELTAARQKLDDSIPGTMIFREQPKPRETFVMQRGQYDKPGERVEPNTPAFLPPIKAQGRPTRLDLARWLLAPENPLTARVYVNRLWQQFFGTGLVKTSEDFGLQGDPPSHPELLDWLAADFREHGWDVKRLVRQLVTSSAFRRSAQATPTLLARDPENRLYARGPRFRLAAEQIRDNALFVSGLMDFTMGGRGVKPYQPENIWEPVAYTGSNTRFYKQDSGPALYRRSLYAFLKRTAPPPFMANFDSPNREQSCSRRERSNTPLQALQLLNDVQHVEAARAFAQRILTEGGATPLQRITFAFRVLLARTPTEQEQAIVTRALTAHQSRFAQAPEDARKLISVGESKPDPRLPAEDLAAYTLIANMLLNLDETLTRN